MATRICVIPGDGIGPEVTTAAVAVLQATGLPFEFTYADAGWATFQEHGTALPDATLEAAQASDAILFGAVASPSAPVAGYGSPIVALRRALDLYANLRPTVSPPLPGARPGVDLLVVRENTEGLYIGQETREGDTAIAKRVITRRGSERITRRAAQLAQTRPNKRLTIVHKANVLRETCGLFRSTALEVVADYPDVQVDELLVDTAAMLLASKPERFDVIVTTNLFGDILSDVACIWGGGLGLAPSSSVGDRYALFEPVHGAAPDIVGKGIANPLAAVQCVAMLFDHIGESTWATRVNAAVRAILASGPHTPDLGGDARTTDVTNAVLAHLL